MSNLQLNAALNMNVVTISLWFRLPSDVAADVARRNPPSETGFPVLRRVVPLIMFGAQQRGDQYGLQSVQIFAGFDGTGDEDDFVPAEFLFPAYGSILAGPLSSPMQPSGIGVLCNTDGTASLDVRIQTSDKGTASNTARSAPSATTIFNNDDDPIGFTPNIVDVSQKISCSAPAWLGNNDMSGAGTPAVQLDRWQHVLISWDLKGRNVMNGSSTRASAFSTMYCAINDVNQNGPNLPAALAGPGDKNTMICSSCNVVPEGGTVSVGFSQIPSNPLWVPGPISLKSFGGEITPANRHVEMAELQIFAGRLLDTSGEGNRRLFIDHDGKPVSPSVASKALGKPEVLLHRSGNWKKGKNTGSIGIDFSPNIGGTINKYKPEPSLHGKQSP